MYNALNEDAMFADVRDRADRLRAGREASAVRRSGRRWWRKDVPPAR